MRARTSRCGSSTARTVLSVCKILYFCKTLTSPPRFCLCISRQQSKQQWAFYWGLSIGFPYGLPHFYSQTDISPHDSPPYRNQGVSFHPKTEDTSSSTWPSEFSLLFYHGYIGESIESRGNVFIHVLEKFAIQPELFCTLPSFV